MGPAGSREHAKGTATMGVSSIASQLRPCVTPKAESRRGQVQARHPSEDARAAQRQLSRLRRPSRGSSWPQVRHTDMAQGHTARSRVVPSRGRCACRGCLTGQAGGTAAPTSCPRPPTKMPESCPCRQWVPPARNSMVLTTGARSRVCCAAVPHLDQVEAPGRSQRHLPLHSRARAR